MTDTFRCHAIYLILGLVYTACAALGSTIKCPESCTCRKAVVKCLAVVDFPWAFPVNTKELIFDEMTVLEIPPNAFKNLPKLKSVEFTRSNIGQLSQCAFSKSPSLVGIKFDKCVIGAIHPYAFRSKTTVRVSLKFKDSQITTVKPYAFYELHHFAKISFKDSTIHDLQTYSFYRLRNVTEFSFISTNFRKVRSEAFRDVTGITDLTVSKNNFTSFDCHNFENITAAFLHILPGNFFQCDCRMNWLTSSYEANANLKSFLASATCNGPKNVSGKNVSEVFKKTQACSEGLRETACKIPQNMKKPDDVCPERHHDDHHPGDHSHDHTTGPRNTGVTSYRRNRIAFSIFFTCLNLLHFLI